MWSIFPLALYIKFCWNSCLLCCSVHLSALSTVLQRVWEHQWSEYCSRGRNHTMALYVDALWVRHEVVAHKKTGCWHFKKMHQFFYLWKLHQKLLADVPLKWRIKVIIQFLDHLQIEALSWQMTLSPTCSEGTKAPVKCGTVIVTRHHQWIDSTMAQLTQQDQTYCNVVQKNRFSRLATLLRRLWVLNRENVYNV